MKKKLQIETEKNYKKDKEARCLSKTECDEENYKNKVKIMKNIRQVDFNEKWKRTKVLKRTVKYVLVQNRV